MEFKIDGHQCSLNMDLTIYSIETIHKCFYWYTGDFEVDINANNKNKCNVILSAKADTPCDFTTIIARIKQDLIDFKLREIVNQETQAIRELIVAKAFANYEMESQVPQSEVSDPVGFNPASI